MKLAIIIALAFFWLFLAYRAYENGDMPMAGVFIVAGTALTLYRLQR